MTNRIKLILATAIAGVLLAFLVNHFTEKRGENTAEVRMAHIDVLAKKPIAAQAETVFVHDTVILRKTIVAYRDARADYNAARDTLNIRDTAQVKTTIAKADTALAHADSVAAKCDTTVKHAGTALYTKKELDDAIERENAAIRKLIPGRMEKVTTAAKWIAGGVALDRLLGGLLSLKK